MTKALHLYIFIGDSRQDAVRRANEAISTRYGRTVKLEETVSCAMGDAEDCIEAIESYASVGVEHFVLNFSCSEPEVVPQIERFASEIMPT